MIGAIVAQGEAGHESISGGYRDPVVVGEVTMAAGMTNNSPAGVRVGVGGTGMSAVLGTDGRFTFEAQRRGRKRNGHPGIDAIRRREKRNSAFSGTPTIAVARWPTSMWATR